MILLDTNVIIDAFTPDSPWHDWAKQRIADGVSTHGAAINAVTMAELCAGKMDSSQIESRLTSYGIKLLDFPAAAAEPCGRAYRKYKQTRIASGGSPAPSVPLPDFFIAAHAETMGWVLVTRDDRRFSRYFPSLDLVTPD